MCVINDFNFENFKIELQLGGVILYREDDLNVKIFYKDNNFIVAKYIPNPNCIGDKIIKDCSLLKYIGEEKEFRNIHNNLFKIEHVFKRAKYNI